MKSILIKTSGDKRHGMGHIVRCWNLAQVLIERGLRVGFATPPDTPGFQYLKDRIPSTRIGLNDEAKYSAVIVDVEGGPSRQMLLDCRANYKRVIVIGGVGFPMLDQKAINELVDLQVYQSIIVTNDYSAANAVSGCKYLILSKDYLAARKLLTPLSRSSAVVAMGGADPHKLTGKVCNRLLESFNGYRPQIKAVFGGAAEVERLNPEVQSLYRPSSLARVFQSARFAVTALGMTTYEAACLGVPTASINWSADHELTAQALEAKGVTVNLGLWDTPDWATLATFTNQMHNDSAWRKMSEAGMALVDGLGSERVSDRIEEIL